MTRTFVDVHVLQTVPPSNLNRDDTGSPKTAVYGGVRRSRVSSQAWKRATRLGFAATLDTSELGVRSKRLLEIVGNEISVLSAGEVSEEQAQDLAKHVITAAGIKITKPRKGEIEEAGYLVFLSRQQARALAQIAIDSPGGHDSAEVKKRAKEAVKDTNSIDIALFGRMVADVKDLSVDAAAQVAHALSVHAVETEYDYFTAVDDHKATSEDEDAGAGMIGTVEFNSATLYRFATVDMDRLTDNLGDPEAAVRAVTAFVRAFVTSMPTGKQNTFANRTLPDAIVVCLREDQPVSLVGAFEAPVSADHGGRVLQAATRLAAYASEVYGAYGNTPIATLVVGVGPAGDRLESLGERMTWPDLVDALENRVRGRAAAAS